jgi:hypothetical protein
MTTFKAVRDIDPLTRRLIAHRYQADSMEAIAGHFESEAQREAEMAEQCAPTTARQHRGAAKAWKQAAAILRTTTIVPDVD